MWHCCQGIFVDGMSHTVLQHFVPLDWLNACGSKFKIDSARAQLVPVTKNPLERKIAKTHRERM